MKTTECVECGSDNVHYSKRENAVICKDCGAVHEELTPAEEEKLE